MAVEIFKRYGVQASDFVELESEVCLLQGDAAVWAHLGEGQAIFARKDGGEFILDTDPGEPVKLTVEQRGRGGGDALGEAVAQLLSVARHDSYAVAFVHTCLYDTREHGMEDYEVRVRTAAAGGDVPLEAVMEGGLWSEPHPGDDQMVDERYVAHISLWAN